MKESILAASIVFVVFLLICMGMYYILNYKNIKNSKKYYENIHKNLKTGKKVEFCGGIYGKVVSVDGDIVRVSVADGSQIEISRYVVTKILS